MDQQWKVIVPAAAIIAIAMLAMPVAFAGGGTTPVSSATARRTPVPTIRLPLTPSPTPFMMATTAPEQRCVPPADDEIAPPDRAIDALIHLLNSQPLLEFFNSGGTAETLRATLDSSGNHIGPYLSQVVEQDITGDSIPEIFLAITGTIASVDYGESHLIMFRCAEGAYQEMIIFRRAGAGSRAEGLYSGGGAHILSIADLNANGAPDLMFAVDWSDRFGEYAEYYVLEWQDDDFHNIVEYRNALMDTIQHIQSQTIGDVALIDLDDDGRYELVVDGVPYHWDGQFYRAGNNTDQLTPGSAK